jgi:acyl-[acyl-carrier-protein]-phospholipid O-acyltransferase/long-chain-fatty-acid--[acyl-carrier-protein] ligase
VIDKSFYDVKFLTPIFKFAGLVPISTTSSKSSLQKVRQKLENNEVVCIFAEGVITRNGCLNKFQKGFEFILKDMDNIPVIPCYIRGLWGSKFSFAKSLQKKLFKQNGKNVSVIFGKKISHPNAVSAKQAIQELSYELQQRFFEDETLGKRLIGAIKKNGNKIIAKENNKKIKGYAFLATVSKIASNIKEHSDKAPIGIAMAPSINATIINFACWLAHKKVININISNLKDLKNTVSEHMIVKIYTAKNLIKDVEENIFDIENSSNIKVVSVEKEIEKHTKGFGFFVKCLAIKFSSVSRLQNILDKKSTQKDNPNNGLNDIAIVCNTNNSNLHQKQNLSHKDILSNIDQMISNMGLEIDSLVVSYKLFYEENYFILSVLLPILNGVKIDFYPNHKNTIGLCKFIAKNQTSLLITDDKFLKDCAQNLKSPALLSSLKSIFYSCCAYDKYNDDVDCKVFRQKFNLEIFSFQTAYAMVVSANSPSFLINSTGAEVQIGYKENSLGMVLLGSFCKVVNPQSQEELGVGEEGEIYIKSTVKNNNMNIDKYNNPFGIGYIDEDGFLFLRKNTNR